MNLALFVFGLFLLFSALGFETSIPDVAARIKTAYTPAASWRFLRAVLAALLIAVGLVTSVLPRAVTVTRPAATVSVSVAPGDQKSVYAAVAAFQKAHGLKADGVVGPETCPLLYKKCPVL